MKVLLMHTERDFDPDQPPPFNEAALAQDLELNTLFQAMGRGDKFLTEVAGKAMLSSLDSPGAIRYRQEILEDCLKHPDVVRQIYQIPIQASERKRKQWLGIFSDYPSGILSGGRQMLVMFVELLRNLKQIADEHAAEFESRGFRRFFAMIQEELSDDYFAVVAGHLRELQFRDGVLVSAELGKVNEGTNYVLRKPRHSGKNWIRRMLSRRAPVYSYALHPRDDAGARALGELRDRGVNLVANAVAQSADHIDGFFKALQLELAFYIGCLNLAGLVSKMGGSIVFPEAAPVAEPRHTFTGLYDVTLALTMQREISGNDLAADHKDLVIITGANQGGKSTFLRSVGLAQLMMQCGMFVPAQSFSANICAGLFTHYKREEDATMESGKFDEELGRMSELVDHISPNAMVLFNESFAATNEREGSEIASQITSALLDAHVKVFFVTHLYELANGFYETRRDEAVFLRAKRKLGGERSFRLSVGKPLQTSFGKDVYDDVFGKNNGKPAEAESAPHGEREGEGRRP